MGVGKDLAATPIIYIMDTGRKWVVVRIDGKIAALSTDYRLLAQISARLADEGRKTSDESRNVFQEITATIVSFAEVMKLKETTVWEDLMLFGTEFQKSVWRKLWNLTHLPEVNTAKGEAFCTKMDGAKGVGPHLVSYSDFAELCQNRAGVRAVAHAVGLNPVSVIIPCHLVVPKESIDKIREIREKAESTIFRGDDLCLESILLDPAIDFGEYALGKRLKRELISMELIK